MGGRTNGRKNIEMYGRRNGKSDRHHAPHLNMNGIFCSSVTESSAVF